MNVVVKQQRKTKTNYLNCKFKAIRPVFIHLIPILSTPILPRKVQQILSLPNVIPSCAIVRRFLVRSHSVSHNKGVGGLALAWLSSSDEKSITEIVSSPFTPEQQQQQQDQNY